MISTRIIHEKYHKKTGLSKKIVNKKNFTYRVTLEVLDRFIKKKDKILDIGSGAGTICFYLTSQGNKVLGLDISKKAIKESEKSAKLMGLKNVKFVLSEFPNFKTTETFDDVILTEVIEHLPNDKRALNKIYNLLKKDGLLILSTPSIYAPLNKLGLTKNFDLEVGHIRRYSLKQLTKLISDSGFKIIDIKKSEGILRNFLFVNPVAGKLVRVLNFSGILSSIVTFIDNLTLVLFGESNYIIVARKVDRKKKKK